MAYPILGTPNPQFLDSSGAPYASGTITTLDPADGSTVKSNYPTADDADASTNAVSADITLDASGRISTGYWGKDNEDYKVVLKDSSASTILTMNDIKMPPHPRRALVTAGNDATPTIAEAKFIKLSTDNTAVTDFDDGEVGDVIHVIGPTTGQTKITDSGSILLHNSDDFLMSSGDTLTLGMAVDTQWWELGRNFYNSNSLTKVVLVDEALTSSTLADSAYLVNWVLLSATFYSFEGYLKVSADAAARDLEIDITTDNAFQEESYSWVSVDSGSALTVDQGETSALTAAVANIDIDGTGQVGIQFKGFLYTHATSNCNVDVQFANQAGAGTVTVEKGSWMRFAPMYN